MTDRHDIWHRLSDHEEFPSAELFDRLCHVLEPGSTLPDKVPQELSVFEKVKEHEVAPPVFLQQRIGDALGIRHSFFRRNRWYIAAAVSLGLIAGSWMIYRSQVIKGGQTIAAGGQKQEIRLPVSHRPDTASTNMDSSGHPPIASAAGAGTGQRPKMNVPFSINGQALPVTDNDLLLTLTSFTYPDVPAYLARTADQPLKVEVDQYTRLYISANMLNMIRETCQLLPDGKSSRKARRMKRRVEAWKEKDQKRFDKQGNVNNPLDPVDLAEFIFR